MAFSRELVAAFLLASTLAMVSARKLESGSSLAMRLRVAEEGPGSCWDALKELQSCSAEVVMFFLNGETHLGANCCSAITVIEHQCWPAMLGTLGITAEESSVLRGYCDAADQDSAAPPHAAASDLRSCFSFPRLHH